MAEERNPLKQTASQTAGPFVHIGLAPVAAGLELNGVQLGTDIAGPNAKGTRIRVEGCILDGTGAAIRDAIVEVWQANANGHYAHPEGGGQVEDRFLGWGRVVPDFETGEWGFDSIKPGACAGRGGTTQAPHLNFWIVARGINIGLNTRMYFAEEANANANDPVLKLIEGEDRRATLISTSSDRNGTPVYRFDIILQGDNETVFFDI